MGFEGRSRAELEAEAGARAERVAGAAEASAGPVAGPMVCLAYVFTLLFLPLFEVECPGVTMSWTGLDLAIGSSGRVGGQLAGLEEAGGFDLSSGGRGDMPADPLVLALPALAGLAGLALVARRRATATALLALLLGVFVYFSTAGFKLEREVGEAVTQEMAETSGRPSIAGPSFESMGQALLDSAHRTTWFWLGLVATLAALVWVNLPRLQRSVISRPRT